MLSSVSDEPSLQEESDLLCVAQVTMETMSVRRGEELAKSASGGGGVGGVQTLERRSVKSRIVGRSLDLIPLKSLRTLRCMNFILPC